MFEAFQTIMARLEATCDASIDYVRGTEYHITLNDFEGFDDEWGEIMRDYADEEMVDALFELLEQADSRGEDDFYATYCFADFSVVVGYASYDI